MRKLLGQAGVTFIEAIVIITAIGTMVAVTTGVVLKIKQNQLRNNFLNQVVFLRDSFSTGLLDNNIWQTTVVKGASNVNNKRLTCLRDKTACATRPDTFSPYDNDGKPLFGYDPVGDNKAGFTRTGIVCNTFDVKNPSDECPVRFEFVMTPKSATVNPMVDIKVNIVFAVPDTSSLSPLPNSVNYEAPPFTRPGTPDVLKGQQCPAKKIMVGFKADGTIDCKTAAELTAPPPGGTSPTSPTSPAVPCTCPKTGCSCDKARVCSCPGKCGKSCP